MYEMHLCVLKIHQKDLSSLSYLWKRGIVLALSEFFLNARDRKGFPLEHVPLLLFHKGKCATINCSKTQPSARRCAPMYVLTASLQQTTLPLLSCHRPKKRGLSSPCCSVDSSSELLVPHPVSPQQTDGLY